MGYRRAEEILPEHIIELIQNYIDGTCLYIPKKENTRCAWGEGTGIREELRERNQSIYAEYRRGKSRAELADRYYLSEKSIQRIIHEKRKEQEQLSG